MSDFRVEATRGGIVESAHRVSLAVVDADGRLRAEAGDPGLVTFWRSAAKPFQAIPLVADGAADRFGLSGEEIALACASHSSEPIHLEVVDRLLARIGCREADLACGPHAPLGPAVAARVARDGTPLTPRWSNCSGKHAGMLSLARVHGWPIAGYERRGHPVQARIAAEVARWSGIPADQMVFGVDGCTTVCFAMPLTAMATAYARLATAEEPAARRVRDAMLEHPLLVAGTGRLCTELMRAWPGGVVAKIGAEGVYSAGLPDAALGLTLKIEGGDMRAAGVALIAALCQLVERLGLDPAIAERLAPLGTLPIRNTRGEPTGELRAAGRLRFHD